MILILVCWICYDFFILLLFRGNYGDSIEKLQNVKELTPFYLGGKVGNCVFYLYFLLLYIIKIDLLSFCYEKGIE
jgi:hypothetical protein